MNPPIDDLLFTLDICADALPFDLLPVHVRRIEAIRAILNDKRGKEQRAQAQILTLYRNTEREPNHKE